MADKKFIRDLNSLIRIDQRKRLKIPAARSAILGGIGMSSVSVDPSLEVEELMYIRHFGGDAGAYASNDVYAYDKNGATPIFVQNTLGGFGLGVNNSDYFASRVVPESGIDALYKNAALFIDPTHLSREARVNSSKIFILDDAKTIYTYDLTGTFLSSFTLDAITLWDARFAVNDEVIGYNRPSDTTSAVEMVIANTSGVVLNAEQYSNQSNSTWMMAACKSGIAFVDYTAGEPFSVLITIFNNAGSRIGTHSIDDPFLRAAVGGRLSSIGITNDRLYIFGASTTTPKCLIYEHSFTLDGTGLATNATLGALLHTVPTPQYNNLAWQVSQSTAMDGIYM